MKDLDYGISDVIFGNDNIPSKTVKFGDGNTLISGVSFGEYGCGVCLVRNHSDTHKPFDTYAHGELSGHVNQSPDDEKVYILFDNSKSVIALIEQLQLQLKELIDEENKGA